jgi:hypothetical protein
LEEPHVTRSIRLCVIVAVVAACAALAPSGGAAGGPVAQAAKSCRVGDSRSYGTTYVLSISARRTSCRKARRVVRAFHDCRPGKRGHCRRAAGYRCREHRFHKMRQSYDSRVTCRRGGKRVRHTYTQFL